MDEAHTGTSAFFRWPSGFRGLKIAVSFSCSIRSISAGDGFPRSQRSLSFESQREDQPEPCSSNGLKQLVIRSYSDIVREECPHTGRESGR